GLTAALKIGCMRAVGALGSVENEDICIDGNINYLKDVYEKSFSKIGADIHEPIVSAASVYAKVIRDKSMTKLHFSLPLYGFKNHVGYGTQEHIQALKTHGVTAHHRKSFKPISDLIS
ncbi:MAG: ribonuclease HII, partial [Candidatus Saccharimonadales bacterium]